MRPEVEQNKRLLDPIRQQVSHLLTAVYAAQICSLKVMLHFRPSYHYSLYSSVTDLTGLGSRTDLQSVYTLILSRLCTILYFI